MEITTEELMAIQDVLPSTQNTFCIEYSKFGSTEKKVLRRINSNGVPISTKKFSEVFFYNDIRHAFTHARFLLSHGYVVDVRKCCRHIKDKFWLI
jgi:uncharacterized protein YqkB